MKRIWPELAVLSMALILIVACSAVGQCPGGSCPPPSTWGYPPEVIQQPIEQAPIASPQAGREIGSRDYGQWPQCCRVSCDNGVSGSGTLISADQGAQYVLTALHVVEGTTRGTVFFPAINQRIAFEREFTNSAEDAAVLRLASRVDLEPIPVAAEEPQPGEVLTLIGWGGTPRAGFFSRAGAWQGGEVHASVAHGDSGGPVLDSQGRLVGVISGTRDPQYRRTIIGKIVTWLSPWRRGIDRRLDRIESQQLQQPQGITPVLPYSETTQRISALETRVVDLEKLVGTHSVLKDQETQRLTSIAEQAVTAAESAKAESASLADRVYARADSLEDKLQVVKGFMDTELGGVIEQRADSLIRAKFGDGAADKIATAYNGLGKVLDATESLKQRTDVVAEQTAKNAEATQEVAEKTDAVANKTEAVEKESASVNEKVENRSLIGGLLAAAGAAAGGLGISQARARARELAMTVAADKAREIASGLLGKMTS